MMITMSENTSRLIEVIEALAGKKSDLVVSFEDLTFAVLQGADEKPSVTVKLSGSVRLDIAYVKE
jgi:hypothetical protein